MMLMLLYLLNYVRILLTTVWWEDTGYMKQNHGNTGIPKINIVQLLINNQSQSYLTIKMKFY